MFNLIEVFIISGCTLVFGLVSAWFWFTIDKNRQYKKPEYQSALSFMFHVDIREKALSNELIEIDKSDLTFQEKYDKLKQYTSNIMTALRSDVKGFKREQNL